MRCAIEMNVSPARCKLIYIKRGDEMSMLNRAWAVVSDVVSLNVINLLEWITSMFEAVIKRERAQLIILTVSLVLAFGMWRVWGYCCE